MHLPDHERVSSLETGCMARHYPSHLELHIPFRRQKKKKGRSAWIPRHMDAAHWHTFESIGESPATLRWARAGKEGIWPFRFRPRSLVHFPHMAPSLAIPKLSSSWDGVNPGQ
jgi:hypothetical protein